MNSFRKIWGSAGQTAIALMAVIGALLIARSALAGSYSYDSFSGEGCSGYGESTLGAQSLFTKTYATPCNYVYRQGIYEDQWGVFVAGPGWVSGSVSSTAYVGAFNGDTQHSGCNPGGPCPNADWAFTTVY
ncbi:MAG: hypothetical protein WBO97_10380 [Tepidiformaceae bacterium]